MSNDPIHAIVTRRSSYRYLFSSKHHGGGSRTDAEWSKDVSRDEEFAVFDEADFLIIHDDRGWLYGVLRTPEGELRILGTWQQQVAEFPAADEGIPWHGYPIYPVNQEGPANRRGQRMRPSRNVQRMEQVGLLGAQQRKRLIRGKHA